MTIKEFSVYMFLAKLPDLDPLEEMILAHLQKKVFKLSELKQVLMLGNPEYASFTNQIKEDGWMSVYYRR